MIGYQELESAANTIIGVMPTHYLDEGVPFDPFAVPVVNTNVAHLSHWIIRKQVKEHEVGPLDVMGWRPMSYHLQAATALPTTRQQVATTEALLLRVAKGLGAPADAVVTSSDPTRPEGSIGKRLVMVGEYASTSDQEVEDPYRLLTVPVVFSIMWHAQDHRPQQRASRTTPP